MILQNENMDIRSIHLKHTNPSLGPHEEVSTVLLTVSESNREIVDRFLESAQINGTLSLHDYLKALKDENQAVLEIVVANAPKWMLISGGTISHLSFYFEDDMTIELSDVYRKYKLTHFNPEFTSIMEEQGTIIRTSKDEDRLRPFKQSSGLDEGKPQKS